MISVTSLSSYLYCPRKLFLERVLGFYEPPKEALVRGSIRHDTYDLINKNEERIVKSIKEKLSLEKIKDLYQREYLKFLRLAILRNKEGLKNFDLNLADVFNQTYPMIMDEIENRSFNIFNFIQAHDLFAEELWAKLTPKIISEFKIRSQTLGLSGIIDQIEVYETGKVPVELKTGKTPNEGVWPGHKIQIAAYMLLLSEYHDEEIKEGFVVYLDSKERRHIPMNAFLRQEVLELVEKVGELLASNSPPAICTNQNKCNICGLKEDCYDNEKINKSINKNKNKKIIRKV
ncbi:MAG: CRISPR-associated protein Cas4 [Nanoarchaeota archaeon]